MTITVREQCKVTTLLFIQNCSIIQGYNHKYFIDIKISQKSSTQKKSFRSIFQNITTQINWQGLLSFVWACGLEILNALVNELKYQLKYFFDYLLFLGANLRIKMRKLSCNKFYDRLEFRTASKKYMHDVVDHPLSTIWRTGKR